MGARRLRNHPHAVSRIRFVAAQEPEAVLQAELVFVAVVFGEFSPIVGDVPGEKVHRTLPALFESGERSRSGDQLPEGKHWLSLGLLHGNSFSEGLFFAPGQREAVHKEQLPFLEGPPRLAVRAVKAAAFAFTEAERTALTEEARSRRRVGQQGQIFQNKVVEEACEETMRFQPLLA